MMKVQDGVKRLRQDLEDAHRDYLEASGNYVFWRRETDQARGNSEGANSALPDAERALLHARYSVRNSRYSEALRGLRDGAELIANLELQLLELGVQP